MDCQRSWSHESRSATNKDVAGDLLYFPEEEDLGIVIQNIAVILVYNKDPH